MNFIRREIYGLPLLGLLIHRETKVSIPGGAANFLIKKILSFDV